MFIYCKIRHRESIQLENVLNKHASTTNKIGKMQVRENIQPTTYIQPIKSVQPIKSIQPIKKDLKSTQKKVLNI